MAKSFDRLLEAMHPERRARVLERVREELANIPEFQPGLYQHYKGGLYVALQLVTHHDLRQPWVLYVSLTFGNPTIRPLHGHVAEGDIIGPADGWCDVVRWPDGHDRPRFAFMRGLPNDVPVTVAAGD